MIWCREKILTSKILIVLLELALLLLPLPLKALLCTAIEAHAPISPINLFAALSVPMKSRTAKVPVMVVGHVPGKSALVLLEVKYKTLIKEYF